MHRSTTAISITYLGETDAEITSMVKLWHNITVVIFMYTCVLGSKCALF